MKTRMFSQIAILLCNSFFMSEAHGNSQFTYRDQVLNIQLSGETSILKAKVRKDNLDDNDPALELLISQTDNLIEGSSYSYPLCFENNLYKGRIKIIENNKIPDYWRVMKKEELKDYILEKDGVELTFLLDDDGILGCILAVE